MGAIVNTTSAKNGLQAVGTNFYGVGGDASIIQHVQIIWDAAFAGTITFESSSLPEREVTVTDTTVGNWIQENSAATINTVSATNVTIANMTITVVAGTANGASVHIGNLGSLRLRVKVVCTAQGQLRIHSNGKQ